MNAVLQAFPTVFGFFSEHDFSIDNTEYLNTDRDKKNRQIIAEISIRCTLGKCMKDVAWQDQIDDQIIDILLPLRTDDMYLFH